MANVSALCGLSEGGKNLFRGFSAKKGLIKIGIKADKCNNPEESALDTRQKSESPTGEAPA
jgi:hypothetical protein